MSDLRFNALNTFSTRLHIQHSLNPKRFVSDPFLVGLDQSSSLVVNYWWMTALCLQQAAWERLRIITFVIKILASFNLDL